MFQRKLRGYIEGGSAAGRQGGRPQLAWDLNRLWWGQHSLEPCGSDHASGQGSPRGGSPDGPGPPDKWSWRRRQPRQPSRKVHAVIRRLPGRRRCQNHHTTTQPRGQRPSLKVSRPAWNNSISIIWHIYVHMAYILSPIRLKATNKMICRKKKSSW